MNSSASQNEELYRAAVGDAEAGYYAPLFYRFDQPGARRSLLELARILRHVLLAAVPEDVRTGGRLHHRCGRSRWSFLRPRWEHSSAKLSGRSDVLVAALGVQLVAVPMFANAVYHWHVRNRIQKLFAGCAGARRAGAAPGRTAIDIARSRRRGDRKHVRRLGRCRRGNRAPRIPGLHDPRAGRRRDRRCKPGQDSVAQAYAATGTWPADLRTIELDARQYQGRYVRDIEVCDGAVLIHYGKDANRLLAGRTLSLHPATLENGEIEWTCETYVAPKYLPSSCRL